MTPTIYLKFTTIELCIDALTNAGFVFNESNDIISKDLAFGAVFTIENCIYVNIYDYSGDEFDNIKLPIPTTPYNERA